MDVAGCKNNKEELQINEHEYSSDRGVEGERLIERRVHPPVFVSLSFVFARMPLWERKGEDSLSAANRHLFGGELPHIHSTAVRY